MADNARPRGKRLLVAAVGVATVSFLGEQGCSSPPRYETATSGNLVPPPHEAGPGITGEGGSTSEEQPEAGRPGLSDTGR